MKDFFWFALSGLVFFYLEFFPVYWLALTAVSMIVLIIILPNFTGRFDKYDK